MMEPDDATTSRYVQLTTCAGTGHAGLEPGNVGVIVAAGCFLADVFFLGHPSPDRPGGSINWGCCYVRLNSLAEFVGPLTEREATLLGTWASGLGLR
jgi:hypothetical protein